MIQLGRSVAWLSLVMPILYGCGSEGSGSGADGTGPTAPDEVGIQATDPASLPGLVLHLESTFGVSVSGTRVLAWADQSESGNDLIAVGNASLEPELTPSGLPAIVLDGVGDLLERVHATAPIVGLPTGNADRTMFVVTRYNGLTWSGGTAYGTGATNQTFGLGVRHPAGLQMLQGFGYSEDLVANRAGLGVGWVMQSAILEAGRATLFEEEVPISEWNHDYDTTLSRLVIGQEIASLGFLAMDVAAVLVYDRALSVEEREALVAFLRQKYLDPPPPNTAPMVAIQAPFDDALFVEGRTVRFEGSAADLEDGDLGNAIVWSSDRNGILGTGTSVASTTLSLGTHAITASVTDSVGLPAEETITLTVIVNTAPMVAITAPSDASIFEEGESNPLTGTASDAVDGDLGAQILWDSSLDGSLGTGPAVEASTLTVGTHTITASVTDLDGLPASDAITIAVTPNTEPSVAITAPSDASTAVAGTLLRFVATARDVRDGDLATQLAWTSSLDGSLGTGATLESSTLSIGVHAITTSVTDSGGLQGSATIALTITTPPNEAPAVAIAAPADGSSFEAGIPVMLAGTALDDRDGDLTARLAWNSSLDGPIGDGGSVQSSTLSLGTHTITASVTDSGGLTASDTITLTVMPNTAPTVAITSPIDASGFEEGELIPFLATAQDARDGDLAAQLAWNSSLDGPIGDGATLQNSTLSLGIHTITASVTDSGGLPASDTLTLSVTPNTAPTVAIIGPANASTFEEGELIQFAGTAVDARDGDLAPRLEWNSSLDGPIGSGATVQSSTLSVGTHTITASVTDSDGLLASETITLAFTNVAPTVTIAAPDDPSTFEEGEFILFRGTAVDTGDGDLTTQLEWSSSLDGLIGSGASIQRSTLSLGTHRITASVTDSGGLTASDTITLAVTPTTAPTVAITAPTDASTFEEGAPIPFTGTAVDARDGDLAPQLEWNSSLDGPLGNGATVQSSTLSVGTHIITASVTDSDGLPASDTITLTLTPNAAPTVTILAPAEASTFQVGIPVAFFASATDPEDDDGVLSATIAWNSSLDGLIGTGPSVSTSALSIGNHTISASVFDSHGAAASDAISIQVTEPPLPLAGLVLHLESTAGVTVNGNSVLSWADLSPRGNDLTAFGGPSLSTELTPSGRPAIVLDGSDDRLERIHARAPISGLPVGNADRSMFVVARYNALTWSGGAAYGSGFMNQAFGLGVRHPAGPQMLQGFGYEEDLISSRPGLGADWLLQNAVLESGHATLFQGETTIAQWNHNYATSLSRLVIGQEIANLGFLAMDVAAVLIYDRALSDVERMAAVAYLRERFLVPANANTAPSVTIQSPAEGATFDLGQGVLLEGSASDEQDGDLGSAIAWTSDRDGVLGSGVSIQNSSLSPGSHAITASVTDSGGLRGGDAVTLNVAASANTAPVVRVTTPTAGSTFEEGEPVPLAGTASDTRDGDLSSQLNWTSTLDGPLGMGTPLTISTLSVGVHQITASVTDSGGLPASAATLLTVTINAAPTVTMSAPATGSSFAEGSFIQFAGTAIDGRDGDLSAQLTWSSSLDGALGTGSLVGSSTLSIGTHAITASVVDSGGLTGSAQVSLRVEMDSAPTVTITAPATGSSFLEGSLIQLAGTAQDARDGDLSAQLEWISNLDGPLGLGASVFSALSVGAHTVTASVTDTGGLPGMAAIALTVIVNPAPTVTITAPLSGAVFLEGDSVQFTGTALDAGDGDMTALLAWSSSLDGFLGSGPSVQSSTLSAGNHTVAATVTDTDGFPGSAVITLSVNSTGDIVPTSPIALFDGLSLDGLQTWIPDSGVSDPQGIFRAEGGLLHVTGEQLGGIATLASYRNYVMVFEFRWGDLTWSPRLNNARDAGVHFHCNGPEGGWRGRFLASIQAQMLEGGTGDLILLEGATPIQGSVFLEQIPCTFPAFNWNCRGGYRWNPTGQPASLRSLPDVPTLHWERWDPDWVDNKGFRGDEDLESPVGDWNQLVAVAAGSTLQFHLNGVQVNEVVDAFPNSGRIQIASEFAEYFVRRWELLPLETPVGPTIASSALPLAMTGAVYVAPLSAVGGMVPRTWTLVGGPLPPGLALEEATGEILGTPTAAGLFPVVLQVSDAQGLTAESEFALEVLPSSADLMAGGLVLRLEASEFTDAGPFSSWSDHSGRGNHVFATGDPVVALAATPSGQPAVVLAGRNDRLERVDATHPLNGLPTGNADRSIFLVVRYDAHSASGGVTYGEAATNQAFGLTVQHPSGALGLQGFGASEDLVSSVPGIGAGWTTHSVVFAGGEASLYRDMAPIAQWSHTYDTRLSRLVIGEDIASRGFVDAALAAVLLYDRALSDVERFEVETYLRDKYLRSLEAR